MVGGALAGLADAIWSVSGGIGGLSVGKALRLIGIDAGLLACAGAVLGVVAALGSALARRTREPLRTGAALAALAAAPVLLADSFAMFAGHLAASLPGHQAISALLGAAGVAAAFLVARRYGRGVDGGSRRAAIAACVVVALGAELANRTVLPRLYLWFHETLAAVTLVAAITAVRLVWRRPCRWRAGALVALAIVGGDRGRGGAARQPDVAIRGVRTDGAGVRGAAAGAVAGARDARRAGDARRARDGCAAGAARRAAPPGGGRPGDHD